MNCTSLIVNNTDDQRGYLNQKYIPSLYAKKLEEYLTFCSTKSLSVCLLKEIPIFQILFEKLRCSIFQIESLLLIFPELFRPEQQSHLCWAQ